MRIVVVATALVAAGPALAARPSLGVPALRLRAELPAPAAHPAASALSSAFALDAGAGEGEGAGVNAGTLIDGGIGCLAAIAGGLLVVGGVAGFTSGGSPGTGAPFFIGGLLLLAGGVTYAAIAYGTGVGDTGKR